MLKIMMAALIVALTILSSCTGSQPANTHRTTEPEKTTAGVNIVTVSFSGLMVLHREEDGPGYELGILIPSVAEGHAFSVIKDGIPISLSDGGIWTLSITNSPPSTHVKPVEIGHPNAAQPIRKPDNQNGQRDFSWIVDLENSEFHGKELDLKPGLLKPIIHLPNVALYSNEKSIDLKRGQGGGDMKPFGFVTETLAMVVELHPGEELVLKDEDKNIKLLGIPYVTGDGPHEVKMKNVRPNPHMPSDFWMYYKLFTNVDKKEEFDFDENSKDLPYNPVPIRLHAARDPALMPSCCGMDCSLILLGTRKKPLQ